MSLFPRRLGARLNLLVLALLAGFGFKEGVQSFLEQREPHRKGR